MGSLQRGDKQERLTRPNYYFFFFNDTATTEIYPLSLHDALPISTKTGSTPAGNAISLFHTIEPVLVWNNEIARSEEHTSELQSHLNLVCRLLLEKKMVERPEMLSIFLEQEYDGGVCALGVPALLL